MLLLKKENEILNILNKSKPWTTGPSELLRHGLKHIKENTPFDLRIAMISIDNSIEIMLKTYILLPKRITGSYLKRKQKNDICNSFSSLLSYFYKNVMEKFSEIDPNEIEWYHRIRNALYHEGNGITVELKKVEEYACIAKKLFKNLFETTVNGIPMVSLEEFFSYWVNLINTFIRYCEIKLKLKNPTSFEDLFKCFFDHELITNR